MYNRKGIDVNIMMTVCDKRRDVLIVPKCPTDVPSEFGALVTVYCG